jgi:hypothetical protein
VTQRQGDFRRIGRWPKLFCLDTTCIPCPSLMQTMGGARTLVMCSGSAMIWGRPAYRGRRWTSCEPSVISLMGGGKGSFLSRPGCLACPSQTLLRPPGRFCGIWKRCLERDFSLAPDRSPWYYAPPPSSRSIRSATRFPFLNYCGCTSCLCLWTHLCELCLHIRACLSRTLRPLTCLSLSFDSYGEYTGGC